MVDDSSKRRKFGQIDLKYLLLKVNKSLPAVILGALSFPVLLPAQQYVVSTFAGGAPPPLQTTALNAALGNPRDMVFDSKGNLYLVSLNCVFRLDSDGVVARIAGTGAGAYSGDGGPAIAAKLFSPGGVAVDKAGNIYVSDTTNARIRRIASDGTVTTVAGNGVPGYAGDGGPAADAQFRNPSGLAIDSTGNVFVLDSSNRRIRKIAKSGIITTVAGNGTDGFSGDGGPAINASMTPASKLAIDSADNLYIADTSNLRVRKVSTDGTITTIAGNGTNGSGGDGGPATEAQLSLPVTGLTVDGSGTIYISELSRIRAVSPTGIITTVAVQAPASDSLFLIVGLAKDSSGNLYIGDAVRSRIRKISPDGVMTVVAGSGVYYAVPKAPTDAVFSRTNAVAADEKGNVLISDPGNSWLWRVSPAGTIYVTGATPGVDGVAVDGSGNYYLLTPNGVIKANFTGPVPPEPRLIAGGGSSPADGIPALSADLLFARGIAVDRGGNIFVSVTNAKVRRISPDGIITTVAGTGLPGFSGDGGPATAAQLSNPGGLATDAAGNLYIADPGNNSVRKVSPAGVITTVAGSGPFTGPVPPPFPISNGDGGPATEANVSANALALDAAGNLYIADSGTRIRKVTPDGKIDSIAGNGRFGYYGDGGPATSAAFNYAIGLAVDQSGNVYVAEQGNNIVRLLRPTTKVLISAVLDAASESDSALAPGKIMTIYGGGLGPKELAVNAPSDGAFGPEVGGTSITINGIAAPMIFASDTQVAALVPYGVEGKASAQVVVTSRYGVSMPYTVPVKAAAPSFFSLNGTGAGQVAAVNLDGSINDAAHPVRIGGYVSFYATGEGQTFPAGTDGALATTSLPRPLLPLRVTIGGIPVTPAYAGAAPTEVLGLMQIVVKIPDGVEPGGYVPVRLQVGEASTVSGATWIAVSAQ